jgi:hypothetical protein
MVLPDGGEGGSGGCLYPDCAILYYEYQDHHKEMHGLAENVVLIYESGGRARVASGKILRMIVTLCKYMAGDRILTS